MPANKNETATNEAILAAENTARGLVNELINTEITNLYRMVDLLNRLKATNYLGDTTELQAAILAYVELASQRIQKFQLAQAQTKQLDTQAFTKVKNLIFNDELARSFERVTLLCSELQSSNRLQGLMPTKGSRSSTRDVELAKTAQKINALLLEIYAQRPSRIALLGKQLESAGAEIESTAMDLKHTSNLSAIAKDLGSSIHSYGDNITMITLIHSFVRELKTEQFRERVADALRSEQVPELREMWILATYAIEKYIADPIQPYDPADIELSRKYFTSFYDFSIKPTLDTNSSKGQLKEIYTQFLNTELPEINQSRLSSHSSSGSATSDSSRSSNRLSISSIVKRLSSPTRPKSPANKDVLSKKTIIDAFTAALEYVQHISKTDKFRAKPATISDRLEDLQSKVLIVNAVLGELMGSLAFNAPLPGKIVVTNKQWHKLLYNHKAELVKFKRQIENRITSEKFLQGKNHHKVDKAQIYLDSLMSTIVDHCMAIDNGAPSLSTSPDSPLGRLRALTTTRDSKRRPTL